MRKEKKKGVIKAKIKRGDEVVFISGKEYNRYEKSADGKVTRVPYRGKVISVDPKVRKVKVEGAMIVKKHQKANPQLNVQGGIIKKEAWVDISNISLIDPKTDKPTRVKLEIRDGQKVRIAKSGEVIPNPDPFARIPKKDAEEVTEEQQTEEVAEEKAAPKKKKSKKAEKKADKKAEETSEEE